MKGGRGLFLAWLVAGLLAVLSGCGPTGSAAGRCVLITRPALPARPTPEEVVDARRLFAQGARFADRRRWGEALDAFRSAQRLVDHPITSYNVARALWQLGRYDDAVTELSHFNLVYDLVRDRDLHDRAAALMERARSRAQSGRWRSRDVALRDDAGPR